MKKHWLSIVLGVAILGVIGLGIWFVKTKIMPYSIRYNGKQQLSTTPNGVGDSSTKTDTNHPSSPTAKSVMMVPLTITTAVSGDYTAPISFRIDIVDANGKVITGSAETVTLSSSSASGQFDSSTAALIPDGQQSLIVKYKDTTATKATLSAFLSGVTGSSLAVVTTAGPPVKLGDITPVVRRPQVGVQVPYTIITQDSYGNTASGGTITWKLTGQNGGSTTNTVISGQADEGTGHSYFNYTADQSDVGGTYTIEADLGSDHKTLDITPTN